MAELTPLQKAQKILATKATIKSALTSKGQTPTDVLDTYDDNILAIKTISSEGTVIDGDSNLELDKTSVSTVTNNTTDKVLEVTVDDAGDVLLEDGAGIEVAVGYDKVKTVAGITADKILAGQSILDVQGTATNDATATEPGMIQSGYTAYVNGNKITGNVPVKAVNSSTIAKDVTKEYIEVVPENSTVRFKIPQRAIYCENAYITSKYQDVATAIELSADKILKGNTVIGVIGTATEETANPATAANIDKDKVAFVNGTKIIGTSEKVDLTSATSDADATAGDILENKTAYVNGVKLTGTAIELKGETKTITPSTSQQTITPSTGKNGITSITVNAVTNTIDDNITAANIKQGVEILGVTGTFTSDANATASDILVGKTAYVNGTKITGTSTLATEKAALEDQIEDLRQELADITDADDATAEMQTIINNLQSEITQLKTDKSTLEGQVTTLTSEKAALQTQIDDIEAVLDQINGESDD